jgi:hypothetical protein
MGAPLGVPALVHVKMFGVWPSTNSVVCVAQ